MRKFRILIEFPDPAGLALLSSMLKSLGHNIEEAANDRIAVRLMERNNVDLVLASVEPGDADALELLSYIRRKHRDVPVILLFPRLHPERAKEALRMGAMAVLKYPVPAAELRAAVLQALEQCESRQEEVPTSPPLGSSSGTIAPGVQHDQASHHTVSNGSSFPSPVRPLLPGGAYPNGLPMGGLTATAAPMLMKRPPADELTNEASLVGGDPSLRQIIEFADVLAATRATVLIVGEPGTGKSLLAKRIHLGGGHSASPLVTLDVRTMVESSSSTDDDEEEDEEDAPSHSSIVEEWSRKLAEARGSTLYIEEVGELPPDIQLQLLRELQIHDYEAAAGHTGHSGRGEIRFILSSSENLPALVEQGRFRPELYHRISAICLMIPPLRLRGTDIELLAEHFRHKFAQEFRKNVMGFSRDAFEALHRHLWPGNIRELQGVIQRAVALCSGSRITSNHLAPILSPHRQARVSGSGTPRPHLPMGIRPLKEALEEPEKRIIIQALQAFNWNRQETARVLDINRTTLYKKMKKYGLLIDEPIWVN